MANLTRREALLATAVASAAAVATSIVHSTALTAVPPAGKQAPGWYRYKVGNYEVTAVTDGVRNWPLESFVQNTAKDDVVVALADAYLETDKVALPYSPIVVNTGSKLVVIDTGLGPAFYETSKGSNGQFQTNLSAAGIDRMAADIVIISHCHADHINGLITADGKPAFPNAEIMVPAAEWKFWMDDGNMNRAPAGSPAEFNFKNIRRVFGALKGSVTQYESGKEIAPGITSVASYGHTPGHTSHIVASGSASIMVQADVALLPALFVRHPNWHVLLDMDGPMAEQTRHKVFDMLSAEKMLLQGFHFPFPGLGHIEKDGSGYRLVPVMWRPTL